MAGLDDTITMLTQRRTHAGSSVSRGAARLTETTSFGSNPGALKMLTFAPPALKTGAPLVVVLHGCTQSAQTYAEGAGWLELAGRHGFALLCPEQTRANNPNLCFNWFQPADASRGGGEAASIAQMVERFTVDAKLDRRRVLITGLSAGGAMTAVMLAAYPEMFAAGAVIAGLPYGAASNVQGAMSAMARAPDRSPDEWGDLVRTASDHAGPWPRVAVWHGGRDMTVRPGAAVALVRQWTNVHGIDDAVGDVSSGEGRSLVVWNSKRGVLVEFHHIEELRHGTPLKTDGAEGCGVEGPHLLDVGISSSLEIARSWGIAERRFAGGFEGAAVRVRRPGAAAPAQRPSPGAGIGGVINQALR
ncbi:MAG: esterase, PHB depolymerase family, partial [Alphaproteobacteria bacterium]